MSDGALSQAEIDALLSGGDLPAAVATEAGGNEGDRQALQGFLESSVDSLSAAFSGAASLTISLKGPEVSFSSQDKLLGELPDTVTAIKIDFNSGFPGEHIFIMAEATAKRIAAHQTGSDDTEMDEMALSVIGEVIGTIVGSQITALTGKTGNKSIASIPAQATNVPKAVVALPATDFVCALYGLDFGDGNAQQFWEIYDSSVAEGIAKALTKQETPQPAAAPPSMAGVGMPPSAMASQGGSMAGGPATSVNPVQFPHLAPHITAQEQGNIGLIMDVFMEMTVELGRTKKLIKEILGMGEGTIIELDKLAGEPVDILVNHKLIAKGEVVVIDENFGVRVTEIVPRAERMSEM